MNQENLQVGYLVESIQGRDKNERYLILTRPDNNYTRLVNGSSRKLINPKLKKIKHIKPLDIKLEKIQEKLLNNVKIFDSEVYSAIKKSFE